MQRAAVAPSPNQAVVQDYFVYVRELRSGKEDAVDKLMSLWDPEGVFEFAGAPPVTATFQGRNAIHVLYRNRLLANGMPLELQKGETTVRAALGVVDTEVHRTRVLHDKIVAGWTTVIGTDQGQGFDVSGAHTFTFKDGKILSLKVVVAPKADPPKRANLNLEGLSVEDIGQLSLAAWAVV